MSFFSLTNIDIPAETTVNGEEETENVQGDGFAVLNNESTTKYFDGETQNLINKLIPVDPEKTAIFLTKLMPLVQQHFSPNGQIGVLPTVLSKGQILKKNDQKQIYAQISNILYSVNPCKFLSELYSTETALKYRIMSDLPPHIFGLGKTAIDLI
uniref:Uncharacterized protein n=1 Tax=Panagrolaimus superbus TaxID=310955 RepID=A0A914YI54_9BILA